VMKVISRCELGDYPIDGNQDCDVSPRDGVVGPQVPA
jgi:hypothetical protein